MFHPILTTTFSGECLTIKSFLDLAILKILGFTASNADIFEKVGTFILFFNLLFLTYFFAKICGLYKAFKDYKIWQKFLIFLLITILIFPVAMFDFKNFEVFNFPEINYFGPIIFSMFFVIPAFLLNLLFNFLTKKFPKPFEAIGYVCSIEFFKDIFKRKKTTSNTTCDK